MYCPISHNKAQIIWVCLLLSKQVYVQKIFFIMPTNLPRVRWGGVDVGYRICGLRIRECDTEECYNTLLMYPHCKDIFDFSLAFPLHTAERRNTYIYIFNNKALTNEIKHDIYPE